MTEFKLREYQRECIDAVFNAWDGGMTAPAVVLPTGAGKTVVFSALIKRWREPLDVDDPQMDRGARVIVLVHRDELADQAINKIRATLPADVTVGKVKARDDDIWADVMVCSVQTLASERRRVRLERSRNRYGSVGLIITDECHHAAAVSYKRVYKAFPDALRLGVTATLQRGDGVGLGGVWDDVVYEKSLLWMISKGHLVDVEAKAVDVTGLDLGGVKTSRGDWQAGDLGSAIEESGALDAIARVYWEHAKDRPGVVFTPTVATAEHAAESLNAAGVRTAVVSGATPREERLRIFDDFRTGKVQVLSNCMVLTEGFDAPWAEVAVIARPTKSAPLYTQMVGRVLRTWPGKDKALVLDMVGASSLGLRTLVDLAPEFKGEVREGETLAEAVVRDAEEQNVKVPAGSIAFELKVRDVDLFKGSDYAWNRTRRGVMFIDVGKDKRIFLWPSLGEPGTWDVCAQEGAVAGRTEHRNLDLSMAMAWGEAKAQDSAEFSAQRSARWRQGKPSDAQVSYAEAIGIETEGMSKGELSNTLSVHSASRVFDHLV